MVNTKQTRQMCNIVLSYNMVITVIFFMAVCWHSVDSTEIPIITRGTYDLVRFPKCGGYSSEKFKCDKVMEMSIPTGDTKSCTCQCKRGYFTYRDPYVLYLHENGSYKYDSTKKGCVWHGYSHEGCKDLESVDRVVGGRQEYPKPIIIDLTQPGSIVLREKGSVPRPLDDLTITPHVRAPAKNQWEEITGISFRLTFVNKTGKYELFKLQWTRTDSNIYAYQGLVMRLDLRVENQDQSKRKCIMTKIAGTFTEAKSCKRHTVDGRCCIFPFVYKNTLYNDCATTDDMTGSWCAVGLDTNVIEGNHKWREKCSVPTAKTSTQRITPEPNTVFPKSTASQPHKSSTTPKVQSPADMSGDSDSNKTIIIAIVVSLVVFLVVLLILVIVCHRCRRISDKSVARKTASDEVVADENGYVTINEESPPRTRRLKNVVYQESMEMSHDRPSAIAAAHPNCSTGHSSSLYDNPDDVRPEVQTDAIYNMPEADYSLITTPDKQEKTDARALGPPDDTSNNVYSEPTDDEQVLVEANPLYGTANDVPCATKNKPDKYSPNKTGEIYDEPSEIPSSKNVYDTPEGTDNFLCLWKVKMGLTLDVAHATEVLITLPTKENLKCLVSKVVYS